MKAPGWLTDLAQPVRRRVRRMTPDEMTMWLDDAGIDSRSFREYVRTGEESCLRETERGTAILTAMVQELRDRS